MFYKLWLFSILVGLSTSQCSEGCVICDQQRNRCRYCDYKMNYAISTEGICLPIKTRNCAVRSFAGHCLSCDQDFFLDTNHNQCVKVPDGKTTPNCLSYNNRRVCVRCKPAFYLYNGSCLAAEKQIDYCVTYLSAKVCQQCERGYIPNVEGTECVTISAPQDNCRGYSHVDCFSCAPGYTKNINNYLHEMTGQSPVQARSLDTFLKMLDLSTANYFPFPVCQKIAVDNCLEINRFNACKKCATGNYLGADFSCVKNPDVEIKYCVRYKNPTECLECSANRYLLSKTQCVAPSVPVENCKQYDTTANQITCVECNTGYFLSEPNTCSKRTSLSTIPNCKAVQLNSENCQTCQTGYTPTTDRGACLPNIPNCITYQDSQRASTALVCRTCKNGYYLDPATLVCTQGTKDYCLTYQESANVCKTCLNKFYLDNSVPGGECKPHDELYLCDQYSSSKKNTCSTCKTSAFLFAINNACVPVVHIPHCVQYSDVDKCSKCDLHYFLNPQFTCTLIPINLFCLVVDANMNCLLCHNNYVLDNGKCKSRDDELLFFCDSHNLDGLISPARLQCNYCKANSLPYNMVNQYSCVETSTLALPAPLAGCQKYDTSLASCRSCIWPKVLSNGACVDKCADQPNGQTTLYLQILTPVDANGDGINESYRIASRNQCGDAIQNCEVAAPDLQQTDANSVKYACVKCLPNFLEKVDLGQQVHNYRLDPLTGTWVASPVAQNPGYFCVSASDTSIVKMNVRPLKKGGVDKCQNYQMFDNYLGCAKCVHGYSGTVINKIFGCNLYSSTHICRRCIQGMYLKKSGKKCVQVTPVPNCETYYNRKSDGCVKCRDHFYLSDSTALVESPTVTVQISKTCTPRTGFTLNCATYATDSESCAACVPNFTLDSLKQCVAMPAFCAEVTNGDCTKCINGYYLNTKVCYRGEVANCLTYKTATNPGTTNSCDVCQNGYYLSNELCLPHRPLANCKQTDPAAKDTCKVCNNNFFLYKVTKTCVPYIPIANCLKYQTIYKCIECAANFYVSNFGTRCLPIPPSSNCLKVNAAGECTDCAQGSFLYSASCVPYYSDVLKNCDSAIGLIKDSKATSQQCKYCAATPAGAFEQVDLANSYRCLEPKVIQIHNSGSLITNCVRYKSSSPSSLVCTSCDTGYILDSTGANCITPEKCFENSANVVYLAKYGNGVTSATSNEFLVKTSDAACGTPPGGLPGPFTDTNCYLSPLVDQVTSLSSITYYCAKCKSGFIGVVNVAFGEIRRFVSKKNLTDKVSPFSYYPVVYCLQASSVKVLGVVTTTNEVAFCEYYMKVGSDYACYKCQFGFQGVFNAGNYINYCRPLAGCTTSTFQDGITLSVTETGKTADSKYYEQLMVTQFTCHQCGTNSGSGNGPVPVAFINIEGFASGTFTGIKEPKAFYNISNAYQATNANNADLAFDINCVDPSQGGTLSGKLNVVGCALYAVNVNDFTQAPKCVACASGQIPKRPFTDSPFIDSCAAGSNFVAAPALKQFNTGPCNPGYAYFYTYSAGIDPTICNQHPDTLCYAANSPNSPCDICMRNAKFNSVTRLCETVIPPYCTSATTSADTPRRFLSYALYLASDLGYCEACEGGRILGQNINVLVNGVASTATKFEVCSQKQPPTQFALSVKSNCATVRYNLVTQRDDCTVCNTGYLNTQDGECASAAANPNCSLVSQKDGTFCLNCINNTISQAGKCVAKSIANCLEYIDSSAKNYIRCKTCVDGFYESFDSTKFISTCVDATPLYMYNCLKYTTEEDGLRRTWCQQCQPNFFLLSVDDKTICHPQSPELVDCITFDNDKLKVGELSCIACSTSSLKVPSALAVADQYSACVPFVSDPKCISWPFNDKSVANNLLVKAVNFVCSQCADTHYFNTVSGRCLPRTIDFGPSCKTLDPINDLCTECAMHYFINSDKTACIPTPAVATISSSFYGFLAACSRIDNCLADRLDGLDLSVSAFASCHKCAETSKIPFVAVKAGSPYSKISGLSSFNWTISGDAKTFDSGKYGWSVNCLEVNAKSFNISVSAFSFPENCGLGVLNVNSRPDASHSKNQVNVDLNKIGVFCGACNPGFKASPGFTLVNGVSTQITSFIPACTAIANCESSVWFNFCTRCAPGFSFGWSVQTGVQYDTCVSNNNNLDCYAYNAATSACVYCNRGLFLNPDGYCERLRTPRCEFDALMFNINYAVQDIETAVVLNPEAVGCNKCERGFTAVFRSSARFVCAESSYLAKNIMPTTTKYIYNCVNFFVDNSGNLKCKKCRNGSVPLFTTGVCIDASGLQNCVVALSSTACHTCASGFTIVNKLCEPYNILNCQTYVQNQAAVEQICQKCIQGYYLETNKCFPGNVPNCQFYETRNRCNKCMSGFQLVIRNEGANYCYPIDPQLNCLTYDSDSFQKGMLQCSECASSNFVVSWRQVNFQPTHCMRYMQIRNCVQYDLTTNINSIADSTFACSKCLSNFYLLNGDCVPRLNMNANCVVYDLRSDGCKSCVTGMYVDADGQCQPNPSGPFNCLEFSGNSTCLACNEVSYPLGNTCVALDASELISKCVTYSDTKKCSRCAPTHFLLPTNTCAEIKALNCLTVKDSPFACSSCAPGFYLKTVGTNVDCVAGTITNCVAYDIKEPQRCLTCSGNFFTTGASCQPTTVTIKNCVVYDSDSTCSQCLPNTALSLDQKTCSTNVFTYRSIDPFCTSSFITAEPICSVCDAGYYLYKDPNVSSAKPKCVSCSTANEGCLLCNGEKDNACLACKSGYYMNKSGVCIKNGTIAQNPKSVIQ